VNHFKLIALNIALTVYKKEKGQFYRQTRGCH